MKELMEHLFVPYSELQEGDELTDDYTIAKSYYLKSEADEVIAEKDKMIAKLKDSVGKLLNSKTEQVMYEVFQKCIIYGEGFVPVEHAAILAAELVNLRRALWLARASMCKLEKERWANHFDLGSRRNRKDPAYVKTGKLLTATEWSKLWENNERKCRAKAEEYK